jgi:hypothetical protein
MKGDTWHGDILVEGRYDPSLFAPINARFEAAPMGAEEQGFSRNWRRIVRKL